MRFYRFTDNGAGPEESQWVCEDCTSHTSLEEEDYLDSAPASQVFDVECKICGLTAEECLEE
jgi:hypothetical protein